MTKKHIAGLGILVIASAAAGFTLHAYLEDKPGATRFVQHAPTFKDKMPPIEAPTAVPKLTKEQADTHRENSYEDIESIDDLLALPGDFAQTEALYAIAGRASVGELQDFIWQSEAITNRYDRQAALLTLFARYAELDPHEALEFLSAMRLDIKLQVVGSIFRSWTKYDPDGAIASVNEIANAEERHSAQNAVLRAYIQTNPAMLAQVSDRLGHHHNLDNFNTEVLGVRATSAPQQALQEALDLPTMNARQQAVSRVAYVWARSDPYAAILYADNIEDPQLKRSFKHSVINRWAGSDPEAAMQHAQALPNSMEREQLLMSIIQSVANNDPAAAFSLANDLDPSIRDGAYANVVSVWAQRDARSAISFMDTLSDERLKEQLIMSVARTYAEQAPGEALQWVFSLNPRLRDNLLRNGNIMFHMARQNPDLALETVNSIESTTLRQQALLSVISTIAMTHPEKAATYLDSIANGDTRTMATMQIAQSWGPRDPDAALAWIDTLNDMEYRQAVSSIAQSVASRSPDRAAAYLEQIRPEGRAAWIIAVAGGYAGRDPQQAVAWLSQFKGDEGYSQAISNVAMTVAQRDPLEAVRLVESIPEKQRRNNAMRGIVAQWAQRDPAAATRWTSTISDPESRRRIVTVTVGEWAQHDPNAAGRWAMGVQEPETRDQALQAVVSRGSRSQLSASSLANLVNGIGSESIREQAIQNAYYGLYSRDRAEAKRFLNRAGASQEQRRRLKEMTRRRAGS